MGFEYFPILATETKANYFQNVLMTKIRSNGKSSVI